MRRDDGGDALLTKPSKNGVGAMGTVGGERAGAVVIDALEQWQGLRRRRRLVRRSG
jgi:hypothetical protein